MADAGLRVGFLPWWPENPYQILLRKELRNLGCTVIGNPPLSISRLIFNLDGLDVVHVHWPHGLYRRNYWKYAYVVLVLLLYRVLKNNIVWTVHELDFYETQRPGFDRFMKWFLMRCARSLILHSRASEAEVLSRYPFAPVRRISIHPSFWGHYKCMISRKEARDKLELREQDSVFLFFGHVKPYKGVEDLIHYFREDVKDDTARLLIVGRPLDGLIRREVEYKAEGDSRITTLLEYIPDDDIQTYMAASDVVVFPFRRTHTSGSLLLALSYGKPVVAPNVSSIPEYVDESMGELFDPEDPGSLGEALSGVLTRDLEVMGRAALQRAKATTWRDFAQTHVEAYRETSRGGLWGWMRR